MATNRFHLEVQTTTLSVDPSLSMDSGPLESKSRDSNAPASDASGLLNIQSVDHIELWVGNARQSAIFYQERFGFQPLGYRGPETGSREVSSYVLQQGQVTLVLSTALQPKHAVAQQVSTHGDFAKHIAFRVADCLSFYTETLRRGAKGCLAPTEHRDSSGAVRIAGIKTYGDVQHLIVERDKFSGTFLPGFIPADRIFPEWTSVAKKSGDVSIEACDHIVGNVELGKMDEWVGFYERALGFTQMRHFSDDEISTEYSALMSKVLSDGSGKIKFPINEPAQGRRKSQIDEYLEANLGPGVQHIALRTSDIIKTVSALRNRGVQFLRVPASYYEEAPKRVGKIKEDLARLAELGILIDRDDDGYLLQIFTKPVQDRPTLFFEVIQRAGSQGFGAGNFKALFEAIEREQAERGNL